MGDEKPIMTSAQMMDVISRNKHLNFIQRLLYFDPEKSPVIDNPDGGYSTHLMSSASDERGPYAFPSIIETAPGKLQKLDPQEAARYASRTNQLIRFKTDAEAQHFAEHYKEAFPPGRFDRSKKAR